MREAQAREPSSEDLDAAAADTISPLQARIF
jgi:hypothetical protein